MPRDESRVSGAATADVLARTINCLDMNVGGPGSGIDQENKGIGSSEADANQTSFVPTNCVPPKKKSSLRSLVRKMSTTKLKRSTTLNSAPYK